MPTYSEDILRLAEANVLPLAEGEPRVELANRLCGDRIVIGAEIREGRIIDIHWQSEGCAILKASAAYLARTLKGKSLAASFENITGFMRSFEADAVYNLPARYKCALLPWQACENFLRERL